MADDKPIEEKPQEPQVVADKTQDEKLSEFLGEKVEGGKVESPKEGKEPPTEEPKKEEPPKVKEEEGVDFDPEKLKKETAELTAKMIAEAQPKPQTPEQKDEYTEFEKAIWEKEGRNPTYKEALDFVRENVTKTIKQEQEEVATKATAEREANEKAQQDRTEAFNKYIDDQLDDLISQGKLHKVVNKEDDKDLGVQERKALFKTMMEVNQGRIGAGKDPIYSIKEIFYEHYKPVNRQPAGAEAPVSMGGRTHGAEEGQDIDYNRDIKNKSFVDIMMSRFR